ncbi:hypothetical protein DNU06_05935 [Putridiphycobacter roseus]|uniref:Uncharacterized protein n=1 Tax=Putridiphycobacter roseus TaxID=2219161 RepID=A0A2W1NFB0_9FLAO|nr:hypothetical protein [Putridiphycobacter roseus]PZE18155.1 hypothetical protein DNU06_05935 [Putridiphycobacter roseus]
MKKILLPLLSFALIIGTSSCKKELFTSGDSDILNYESSNNFVINPGPFAEDSLASVVFLEKIDFLCDIDEKREQLQDNQKEGYELKESTTQSIRTLSFVMEERNADTEQESLGTFLKKSSLQIYHGEAADIEELGTCNTVTEVGQSYDRLTFEIDSKNIIEYMVSHPDYQFRVVNTFNSVPQAQRTFKYDFSVAYSADHIYTEI